MTFEFRTAAGEPAEAAGGLWPVAVVVPARNEERRIGACLAALAASLGGRGGAVVVVNNTEDGTAEAARAALAGLALPGLVVEAGRLSGVGAARRIGLDRALARLTPDGVLMTTDADALVAAPWVAANLAELGQADLVCGDVTVDPAELAALPPGVHRVRRVGLAYLRLTAAAVARLDPVPHDPAPPHLTPAGASLAFRRALYEDVGMPELDHAEDRAFAALAARDWRIRHSMLPVVVASCRMTGRTAGGMAGALRAWAVEPDPLCDELFEPAAATILRYGLRGRLRRAHAAGRAAEVLAAAGLPQLAPGARFGALWDSVEAAHPGLVRRQMRLAEVEAEIPHLEAALAALPRQDAEAVPCPA